MLLLFKFKNKKIFVALLLLILSLVLTSCVKPKEGLVATVNGEEITQVEFDSDFQVFKNLYERQLGEGALSQTGEDGRTFGEVLKEEILEKIIIERIIAKQAESMDITVTDEEVKAQMDQYLVIMGGEEKFNEFLSNNQLSREFFETNTKKELLVDKYKDAFLNNISITDKEAEDYFNENKEKLIVIKASHILVSSEEEGKKILERLKSGESFASIAAIESLDSISGGQGGDLGYFTKGFMAISEFEEAAFALEVGEISDLVKTEVGYHIIYLEDRKDTYEDLKNDIKSQLKEDKYTDNIQDLREKAKVKKYLDVKAN